MGAIREAMRSRQAAFQNKFNIQQQIDEVQRIEDEIAERNRLQRMNEAKYVRDQVMSEVANPLFWKTAKPEDFSKRLYVVNQANNTLNLPRMEQFDDPRDMSFSELMNQTMVNLQNGIGVAPDGTISDLALQPFEALFGDEWLRRYNVNLHNEMAMSPSGLMAVAGGGQQAPPGEKLPTGGPTGEKMVSGETNQGDQPWGFNDITGQQQASQPQTEGQPQQAGVQPSDMVQTNFGLARNWRDNLKDMLAPYAQKPLSAADRESLFSKMLSAYMTMSQNPDVTPEQIDSAKQSVIAAAEKYHIPFEPSTLDMLSLASKPVDPFKLAQQYRMQFEAIIKDVNATYSTASAGDKTDWMTLPQRQQAWQLMHQMADPTLTPDEIPQMPDGWGRKGNWTYNQQMNYGLKKEGQAFNQDIAQKKVDIAWFNAETSRARQLASDKHQEFQDHYIQWKMDNGVGLPKEAKADPWRRGPNAIKFALSSDEMKKYGPFFGKEALLYAPISVRQVWQKQAETGNISWDSTNRIWIVEDAAQKAFENLSEREEKQNQKRINASSEEGTSGATGQMTDDHGYTYKAGDCITFVKKQLGYQGKSVPSSLRSLPTVKDVRAGDVIELQPAPSSGYDVPHWVLVNSDGKTVSEFQSKKVNGKGVPLGITTNRTVDSLRSRVISVRRPGGKPSRSASGGNGEKTKTAKGQVSDFDKNTEVDLIAVAKVYKGSKEDFAAAIKEKHPGFSTTELGKIYNHAKGN